jgi:hypothetical protein
MLISDGTIQEIEKSQAYRKRDGNILKGTSVERALLVEDVDILLQALKEYKAVYEEERAARGIIAKKCYENRFEPDKILIICGRKSTNANEGNYNKPF